MLGIQYTICI